MQYYPVMRTAAVKSAPFADGGYGYDPFGLSPPVVARALGPVRFLYDHYFRVTSTDARNIPATGSAILASNHSGTLPLDGVMIYADIVNQTDPPRIPRVLMDYFVPQLPFLGTFLARVGAVSGTRRNLRRLLAEDELVLVFPEGVPGITKPFAKRYQLQAWRVGHAEMAIRHRVPIVPVAVIGAEEQWPVLFNLRWIRPFGAPHLPVPATPLPLPVHYHIYYGKPIDIPAHFSPDDADDTRAVERAAWLVENAVKDLIRRGLEERKGVFR